jgi:hypothetical protein
MQFAFIEVKYKVSSTLFRHLTWLPRSLSEKKRHAFLNSNTFQNSFSLGFADKSVGQYPGSPVTSKALTSSSSVPLLIYLSMGMFGCRPHTATLSVTAIHLWRYKLAPQLWHLF